MRFHVPNLPHTMPTRAYDWCAYTAKVRRFKAMMQSLGHSVMVYTSTPWQREEWYPGEDWSSNTYGDWDVNSPAWREHNAMCISEIRNAMHDQRDIIALIGGACQQPIADAFPANMVCEWGIGYKGLIERSHKVYESNAWMMYMHGQRWRDDGVFYDTVIPNAFDPADFHMSNGDGEYLLYLGRITTRKGIQIVADTARATKLPLILAGQLDGDLEQWDWSGVDVQHVGVVLGDDKSKLLAGARCLLAPTLYIEPFGGVTVEAMMSGVPAITTDFGVFPETIRHGETGFRCSTLQDFVDAVDAAPSLEPERISSYAVKRFSVDSVCYQYDAYFKRLATLWGDGWYTRDV